MKKGDLVYALFDGKWGRNSEGVVTGVRAQQIRVKFTRWAGDEEVEWWFYRRKDHWNRPYAGDQKGTDMWYTIVARQEWQARIT